MTQGGFPEAFPEAGPEAPPRLHGEAHDTRGERVDSVYTPRPTLDARGDAPTIPVDFR